MPTIHADPYRWPFDGDLTPANTALIVIDMQTDFCGPGGYVNKMGYAISLTRAPSSPSDACSPPRAPRLSHLARARGPPPRSPRPSPNKRWHSARSAPASAIRLRAARSWCAASPAGRSFPNWRHCPASPSSTSRARVPFAPQTWSCCCALRAAALIAQLR